MKRVVLQFLKSNTSNTNPIPGEKIAEIVGISDDDKKKIGRSMRGIIHDLRVAGYPICANDSGYFYGTSEDVDKFLIEFERRVASQHKAISGMKKGLSKQSNDLGLPKIKMTAQGMSEKELLRLAGVPYFSSSKIE